MFPGLSREREGRPVPTYRVTYRFPTAFLRLIADMEAEDLDTEQDGAWPVLWRVPLVTGQPRRIVRLRVSARKATIERLCGGPAAGNHRAQAGPGLPAPGRRIDHGHHSETVACCSRVSPVRARSEPRRSSCRPPGPSWC